MISVGPRTQPLLAYAALALEHQQAITLLIRNDLCGSALALVRPVIEILWRANWTLGVATDEQVETMRKGDFKFPDSLQMVRQLDKAFSTGTFFEQVRHQTWTALNSYTHSGILQLASRYTGGELSPTYSDGEKITAINSSLIALALLIATVLRVHNRIPESDAVMRILTELTDGTIGAEPSV